MKRILSVLLAAALALSLAGCGLFSDSSVVKLGDSYTHKDPKGVKYDTRLVLKRDGFGKDLEQAVNVSAYPDSMIYDNDGNVIGIYDYDDETGLAVGWTNMSSGSYTAFAPGEEVDLGKPDESMMIAIPGDVTLYFVVYGNKDSTESAYMYLMLSDSAAKDTVKSSVEACYGVVLTEESETVLTAVQDANYISSQFADMESYGMSFDVKSADAYAEILSQTYGVRADSGSNPYKPYAGHSDPEDLDFDQRVVLTGSGAAAVDEKYDGYITSMTDYIYGKDGKVVAQYTYYECATKENSDELMDSGSFFNPVRISDTVIQASVTGQDMADIIAAYEGYNVVKDDSVDEYVRMIEETYFSVVCE